MPGISDKIKIFYSYSHDDEILRKKLDNHITFLKRDSITTWYDREIIAGHTLNDAIQKELNDADIILLLVSSSFISSFYCYEVEMKRAMERHDAKEAIVVPVLLSDCIWQNAPFAKLLLTPNDAKPVDNPKHWATINEAITNVAKALEKTVKWVKEKKSQEKNATTEIQIGKSTLQAKEILDNDNIAKSIELLQQEAKELNFNSTKEDIARLHNLRAKFQNEVFKEIDNQIDFITSKRELMYSSALFDTIYAGEILDQVTFGEIQKIRENNESYKWYDRSVIVSALSLSLINFKFDAKKANLLLDFVTDFEPKVWERALTGLTIGIIYQKNRSWLRATNFIHRLETLQNNEQIQEGLKTIDFILKNELYKSNLYNVNLFEMDLFKSPMNAFVPFYENNSFLKTAIDNADKDFDITEFQKYIYDIPLIDSHKYTICVHLSNNLLMKEKLEKDKAKIINYSLRISNDFSPYQNLISEYYFFFNYFPDKLKDDVFKSQLLLTKTDLKKHILNKVNQLLLEANTLYQDKLYPEAIIKYQDLLRIEPLHKDARWQLGYCYLKGKGNEKEGNKKALDIYLKLEKEGDSSEDILYKIACCYNYLKLYNKSNFYCNRIEKNSNFRLLALMSENFYELSDNLNCYLYCQKAEEKALDSEDFFFIASTYNFIEKNDDALRVIKKILETNQSIAKYWRQLGVIYCDLYEWDLSISSSEKALELDANDAWVRLSLGRAYFLSKQDLVKAKELLENVVKRKNNYTDIGHGNLGHFYLFKGNTDMAFEHYVKCIQLLKDETDFSKRMEIDLKHMLRLGISEDEFISLKNKVIEHYRALVKEKASRSK